MSIRIMSNELKGFIKASPNEEALDQPIYHIQTYPTTGQTQLTFFNTAIGSAANGLSDTNMDASAVLSAGKRYAVFSIMVGFFASPPMVNSVVGAVTSPANDAKNVLEGIGNLQFRVLDKTYLTVAPLAFLPAGFGTNVVAGGIQTTQAAAAAGFNSVNYGSNGLPSPMAARRLRVPIPIPQQVRFEVTLNWNAAVPIGTASRIGIYLDGILIRARQ